MSRKSKKADGGIPRVFLTHSSVDKAAVREIRRDLTPFSLDLWLDEIEILPGDSLFGKIGEAIEAADCVLAFLSSRSVKSKWVKRELNAFLANEAEEDESIVVIPILLKRVSPPAFLTDRLQVRVTGSSRAKVMQQILKGIFRIQSVILVGPNDKRVFELRDITEEIMAYHSAALEGKLLVAYDYHLLTSILTSGLTSDPDTHFDQRLRLAWPRCMDVLTAITPRLIATIAAYSVNDVAWPFYVDQFLKLVWRLVILTILSHRQNHSTGEAEAEFPDTFQEIRQELAQLNMQNQNLVENAHFGPLHAYWLCHLNLKRSDCYDIGFRGALNEKGVQIFDANHVPIPRDVVREDSLTVFRGTPPDTEFFSFTWLKYILPYIVADKVLEIGFGAVDLFEAIPRIGLRKDDYNYFGLE